MMLNIIDVERSYNNPQIILQLMEDLKECGFKPRFSFEDGILKLIIKKYI